MKRIEFIKPVYSLSEIPKRELPTVVLCGRSNVGKSSFINSIFAPLKVAKTSSTPGKTRSLNYYLVEDKFYIVDLPGFGYAQTSKSERDGWQKIIEKYFQTNKQIMLLIHFIDSRHEPMKTDIQLNHFLRELDTSYWVILNKIDKLKQSEIAESKKRVLNEFPELILNENLFLFSTISGIGKKEMIKLLSKLFLS
jgi:GTP-binding protein